MSEIIDELEKSGLPGLCYADLVPGIQVALDYCGSTNCQGMLWLRLANVTPSVDFPNQAEFSNVPLGLHSFEIEVGLVRSAPLSNRAGAPPSAAAQVKAARIQMADMSAIRRSVCRYLTSEDRDYMVGQYLPIGPDGGCVGGSWLFTIRQDF